MPASPSARLGLIAPAGSDNISIGDDQIRAIVTALDLISGIFQQGLISALPPSSVGTPGIRDRFYYATDVKEWFRDNGTGWDQIPVGLGGVTASLLADAVRLGLTDGTQTRRGKSIIPTAQTRTNTAYGLLTTPDRVQSVILPTDGLIAVAYQATWQESVTNAAMAALFVGSNQLKRAPSSAAGGAAPVVQETSTGNGGGVVNQDMALATFESGLLSESATAAPAYTGDVTTGQLVGIGAGGGVAYIFAAAGTYDVSVQFKASSGSVTVKNRKLWVWTTGF